MSLLTACICAFSVATSCGSVPASPCKLAPSDAVTSLLFGRLEHADYGGDGRTVEGGRQSRDVRKRPISSAWDLICCSSSAMVPSCASTCCLSSGPCVICSTEPVELCAYQGVRHARNKGFRAKAGAFRQPTHRPTGGSPRARQLPTRHSASIKFFKQLRRVTGWGLPLRSVSGKPGLGDDAFVRKTKQCHDSP